MKTRSNRRSNKKTLRGGAGKKSKSCAGYLKEKLAAINQARVNLHKFAASWTPADASDPKMENLSICADFVSSHLNNAFYHLNAAEDFYVETCSQSGGANIGSTLAELFKAEKKRKAEELAILKQKSWTVRRKRFIDLVDTHISLLEGARNTLNTSIDKKNECFTTCQLEKATTEIVNACAKIDDMLYLIRTSACN